MLNASTLYSHSVLHIGQNDCFIWSQSVKPFQEIILSWNAFRPKQGYFIFSIRSSDLQPWIKVAKWGKEPSELFIQNSYPDPAYDFAKLDVDAVSFHQPAHAFQIKVEAKEGATLETLHTLFAALSIPTQFKSENYINLPSIAINHVKGYSQMALNHPRAKSLCSATSLFSVLNFLNPKIQKKIEDLAEHVYDGSLDIYGNWSLNVAGAYEFFEGAIPCAAYRLNAFEELHQFLKQGLPVVVSVKGEIEGAPKDYPQGHLMMVKGWDNTTQEVICHDPAFPASSTTEVRYPFSSFTNAWEKRYRLAYIFKPLIAPYISKS